MAHLSLRKILLAVLGILAIRHRHTIVNTLEPFGLWFRDSLFGILRFPKRRTKCDCVF